MNKTVAHNLVAKLSVAFVAVAMLFTLATPAKAATADEMQQMITDLLAQVAALQGQMGSNTSAMCPYTWTRSLTMGSTGADVMKLQQFLNTDPATTVTASGAGSVGMETQYYGPATAAAVSKFQVKHALVAVGTGYFGPLSMAKANALCASAPTPTPGDDNDDDDDDDTDSDELSGEASLDTFEVSDGEDSDDVEEGSEDVQVAEFNVEFSDGDAMITRLDVALVGAGNTESDPWDAFDEVSLWVDGDEVARMDVSDEDNYLDEDDGSLRFSGLDIVAMEDEELVIVVGASVAGSIDDAGSSTAADWDVTAESIRYVDADDVTTTDDATGDLGGAVPAEFVIEEAGAGDDLDLEASDEDPDGMTIELSEDDNTEEAIFAFDLSAEDSDGDVTLNDITIDVNFVGGTADQLVSDFRLEIGGESYDVESYSNTVSPALLFDLDGDVTVNADETVTAVLYADFENMDDDGLEGSTVYASTSASDIDAEGEDDITVGGSSVVGETHTLRTEGVSVEYVDDAVTEIENDDTSTTDDEARFTLEFDVTSFGDTVYLPFGAASTTDLTSGVEFSIINTNTNAVVSTGTYVASLDMDDDGETNSFKVTDGETNTFTLTVTYSPTVSGSYKLRLDDINFATTDAATATETQDVTDEDVDTASVQITS